MGLTRSGLPWSSRIHLRPLPLGRDGRILRQMYQKGLFHTSCSAGVEGGPVICTQIRVILQLLGDPHLENPGWVLSPPHCFLLRSQPRRGSGMTFLGSLTLSLHPDPEGSEASQNQTHPSFAGRALHAPQRQETLGASGQCRCPTVTGHTAVAVGLRVGSGSLLTAGRALASRAAHQRPAAQREMMEMCVCLTDGGTSTHGGVYLCPQRRPFSASEPRARPS